MTVDLNITGRVESLHLEPGDRVIVTLDDRRSLTQALADELRHQLKDVFPDNEVVIVAAGLRIAKEAA